MLADLKRGTKRLGGSDAKKRLAAARLLSAAGMTDPAVDYLPPLAEVCKSTDPAVINLYAACQQSLAEKDQDVQRLGLAWGLSQMVLAMPQLADECRDEAVQRLVALIPLMPPAAVAGWIERWAQQGPHLGLLVLAAATQRVEQSYVEKTPAPRLAALMAEHRLVEGLLAAGPDDARWKAAIRIMTLAWMNEAAYTVNDSQATNLEEVDLSDPSARGELHAGPRGQLAQRRRQRDSAPAGQGPVARHA